MTSDPTLKQTFTLEVKNRFDALSDPSDSIDTRYNNLIISNEEIALSTLPKKEKVKGNDLSAKDLVKNARKELIKVKSQYLNKLTRNALKNITQAQNKLDEAYATAEADYIQGKINKIACLHTAKQHAASWKVINELAGRKEKPSIRIKGGSAAKRRSNWLLHFKSLLGNLPK